MRIAGGTAASAGMPALPMPTVCKMHSVVLPPQVRRWRAGLVPRLVAAARPQSLPVCPAVWHRRPGHRLPLRPGPGNPHRSHGRHRWADWFFGLRSMECQLCWGWHRSALWGVWGASCCLSSSTCCAWELRDTSSCCSAAAQGRPDPGAHLAGHACIAMLRLLSRAGVAAANGILIKGGDALERACR